MTENTQFELFPEDIYDALRHVVAKLGGAKKVGSNLWPHKPPQQAGEYLLSCLNSGRNEKLELGEILWMLREARKAGYHGALHFICEDAGYDVPRPVNKEQRKAELMEKFTNSVESLEQIKKELKLLVTTCD